MLLLALLFVVFLLVFLLVGFPYNLVVPTSCFGVSEKPTYFQRRALPSQNVAQNGFFTLDRLLVAGGVSNPIHFQRD